MHLLSLLGCLGSVLDTGGIDTGYDTDDQPAFSVAWGEAALELSVTDSDNVILFGLVETDSGCGDDCWTGEDCTYGLQDTATAYLYCHPVEDAALSLAYGGEREALEEGAETVFDGPSREDGTLHADVVTYYAETEAGRCFVWGADADYYSDLSCQVPAE